ncbi:MAG TPA: hypothetical protein EYQ24_08785 [Bacteroidetes bacterium]|nr:hypothetical protein [Rhodothermaceae bacterium]PAP78940.1 hypothetical protein B1759_16020 [Rubrivirga sp. SAORIC476]HIG74650.1 hypothetical protein [Bacteroidota bacterium]HIL56870.1 hypothetical protein [Rhodothermales bacterium]
MHVRITRLILLGLIVGAVVVGARLLLGTNDVPPTDRTLRTQPTETEVRAVLVTPEAERLPHKPGVLAVTLVEGVVPPAAVEAQVLTDEDCAPDAVGVSRCLNRLDVGGSEVAVRHPHRMHEVACLRPGETVRLIDRATYDAM